MEPVVYSITVCFTHFLFVSALHTLPSRISSDENQTTEMTGTSTEPEQTTSASPSHPDAEERQTHSWFPPASDLMISTNPTNHTTASPTHNNNTTGSVSNATETAHTLSDQHTPSQPFVTSPVSRKGGNEDTDAGNEETASTLTTLVSLEERPRGKKRKEGSYTFTTDRQREERYTTANAEESSTWNLRLFQTFLHDIGTTRQATSILASGEETTNQGWEHQTSTTHPTQNPTTTQTDTSKTSSAHTQNQNQTGPDSQNITDISTSHPANISHTEKCSNKDRVVCFITSWTLAMIAAVFLGISIFLWVRLSTLKKEKRRKREGGGARKRDYKNESLWADPEESVEERVEFWYIHGSVLDPGRKDKNGKRKEKRKRHREESDEENLWPTVTADEIEMWYAERQIKSPLERNC